MQDINEHCEQDIQCKQRDNASNKALRAINLNQKSHKKHMQAWSQYKH